MRARATFGVELSNLGDRVIQLDARSLPPIEITDRNLTVRIEPKTHLGLYRLIQLQGNDEEAVDEGDPEVRRLLRFDKNLDGFKAVAIREVDSVQHASAQFANMFRTPVYRALQRVLTYLRYITNDPGLDVYLQTFKLLSFDTDSGERIYDVEEMDDYSPSLSEHILTEEEWEGIAEAIAKGRNVPVASEVLLNARMFFQTENYGMALLNAAMVCEYHMGRIVSRKLSAGGAVTESAANSFADKTSNRQLPTLLAFLGVVNEPDSMAIHKTFDIRNQMLHGLRQRVSQAEADKAITMAQRLQDIALDT